MEGLPTFYEGITPELVKKAEEELNETPEVKNNGLKVLEEFLKNQQDILCKMDGKYLLSFLRVRKFNVEESLKVLHNYISLQQKYSGIYMNKLPSELKNMVDMNVIFFSRYRLPDMSHIIGLRLRLFEPNKGKIEDMMAYIITWCYITIEYEVAQIAGFHIMLDLADVTFLQYTSLFTWSAVKFAVRVLQDSFPLRIRGIHVVNGPFMAKSLYNMVKVFGKKKLLEKIHCYDDIESLYKIIPKKYLPHWYGGTMTALDGEELATLFYSHEDNIRKRKH